MAVMKEGDKGDFFYVVESGVYDVLKGSTKVHTYRVVGGAHPSFGELALMCAKPFERSRRHGDVAQPSAVCRYAKPRAATVQCVEAGTLWGLDRAGFREAQKSNKGVDVTKVLSKVTVLSMLRFDQLQQLRDHMTEVTSTALLSRASHPTTPSLALCASLRRSSSTRAST